MILICIGIATITNAQQFQLEVYFEDRLGNKDTIVIGYDSDAQDSLHADFDGENLIAVPLNSGLDVRLSNRYYGYFRIGGNRIILKGEPTYLTKKKISRSDFNCTVGSLTLEIHTKNWPVFISWNNFIISPTNTCDLNLVLTSFPFGTWWDSFELDCFSFGRHIFSENEVIGMVPNCMSVPLEPYSYSTDNNDTVSLYPFVFLHNSILYLSNSKSSEKNYKVYPNPINDKLYIEMEDEIMNDAILIDMNGRKLNVVVQNNYINFEALPSGIYFLQFKNRNGDIFLEKVVKM